MEWCEGDVVHSLVCAECDPHVTMQLAQDSWNILQTIYEVVVIFPSLALAPNPTALSTGACTLL